MLKVYSPPRLFSGLTGNAQSVFTTGQNLSHAKPGKRELLYAFLFFMAFSAACLLFSAFSSPFFRFSSYSDSNVYFAVARSMRNGQIPYRDVFDHKGVLLYLIYYLAVWISPTSMFGVYLLLTISLAATLFYGYRFAKLFLPSIPAVISSFAIILFSVGSPIYENGGGSTEEFFMPCIMACLFYITRHQMDIHSAELVSKAKRFSGALLGGVFCAVILWVKFSSLVVLFLPYVIFLLDMIFRKKFREVTRYIASFLLGVLLLSFLPMQYLIRHELFSEFWNTYVVFNLKYASSETEFRLGLFIQMLVYAAVIPSVFTLFGLWFVSVKNKLASMWFFAVWISHVSSLIIFMIALKKVFPYYFLVFAPMTILGSIPLAHIVRFAYRSMRHKSITSGAQKRILLLAMFFMLGVTMLISSTRWPMGSVLSPDTVMEKAATAVNNYWDTNGEEGRPNIIHFACVDKGMYELCDTFPQELYFYQPYINGEPSRAIINEQVAYIQDGDVDFIVYITKADENIDFAILNEEYFLLYEDASKTSSEFLISVFAKKHVDQSFE